MGAWGVEVWQNDSAHDWLYKTGLGRHITKVFQQALRPLKERRVIVSNKRRRGFKTKPLTMPVANQHAALAAVELLLSVPVLYRQPFEAGKACVAAAGRAKTMIEAAKLVLGQLMQDEGFIQSWNQPKKYIEVLRKTELRVLTELSAIGREHREAVGRHVRRIRRMSKAERDRMVKAMPRKVLYHSTFREAFRIADGRDLP